MTINSSRTTPQHSFSKMSRTNSGATLHLSLVTYKHGGWDTGRCGGHVRASQYALLTFSVSWLSFRLAYNIVFWSRCPSVSDFGYVDRLLLNLAWTPALEANTNALMFQFPTTGLQITIWQTHEPVVNKKGYHHLTVHHEVKCDKASCVHKCIRDATQNWYSDPYERGT